MNSRSLRSWLRHGLVLALAVCASASALASQTLLPATAQAGTRVGASVAIGTDTLVVGAPDDSESAPLAGAAYIYARVDGQWVESAKLLAPATGAYSSFGETVATSRQFVVVGAPYDNTHGDASGAAFVYARSGDTWTLQCRLSSTDAAPGQQFGASLAIDGNTIVVGAYLAQAHDRNAGAAYVFTRAGHRWVQRAKLTASDPSDFAFFGAAVAIKGHQILVGAPVAQAAYLFRLQRGSYVEQARVTPFGAAAESYTAFGASVAIDQHAFVIGAPLDSEHARNAGAAFVFRYNAARVTPQTKLLPTSPQASDEFGTSVAVDDFLIAVGAPYAGEHNEGSVALFHSSQSRWHNYGSVHPALDTAFFGNAIDLHDDELVTGAPSYGANPGAAFVASVRQ